MWTRRVLVLATVGFAACSPMRRSPVPGPVSERRLPDLSEQARPGTPLGVAADLGCLKHPRIDLWERRLRSHGALRATTQQGLERGEPYLPRLREIMAENGLPPSLALLPVVESGFRPRARGHFGDRGLWQLRTPTARRFGLVVTPQRDDRVQPEESTRAAARYLRVLHRRYRDWPLALAAYNAGEARVDRARKRNPGSSFWRLADEGHLPRTSWNFVPRFFAVVRVSEGRAQCDGAGVGQTQVRREGAVRLVSPTTYNHAVAELDAGCMVTSSPFLAPQPDR